MSRQSADTILLEIEPSAGLTAALAAGHCVGFLAGVASGGRFFALAWLCVLGAGLFHALRREALRVGPGVVVRMALGPGVHCLTWDAAGGAGQPGALTATLVSDVLVVLRVERVGARTQFVVVCADAVAPDEFRRLRARCHLEPAA